MSFQQGPSKTEKKSLAGTGARIGGLVGIASWFLFGSSLGREIIGYDGGFSVLLILMAGAWAAIFSVIGSVIGSLMDPHSK